MSKPIWDGILAEFPDYPAPKIFESDHWLERASADVARDLASAECLLPPPSLVHEYPIPILCAVLQATHSQQVRVLDFGGGLGNTYAQVRSSIPKNTVIHYKIVESRKLCLAGGGLFADHPELSFCETLPDESYDVVHAGASLHYVRDWRSMLQRFVQMGKWIVLSGLTAGDIPTFVTRQNYYGQFVPVWFWNVDEVISAAAKQGAKLVYKSLYASEYWGEFRELPMDNFPEGYRLNRKCNLIFCKMT